MGYFASGGCKECLIWKQLASSSQRGGLCVGLLFGLTRHLRITCDRLDHADTLPGQLLPGLGLHLGVADTSGYQSGFHEAVDPSELEVGLGAGTEDGVNILHDAGLDGRCVRLQTFNELCGVYFQPRHGDWDEHLLAGWVYRNHNKTTILPGVHTHYVLFRIHAGRTYLRRFIMQDETETKPQLTYDQIMDTVFEASKTSQILEIKGYKDGQGRVRDYVLRMLPLSAFTTILGESINGLKDVWNPGDYPDDVWESARHKLNVKWRNRVVRTTITKRRIGEGQPVYTVDSPKMDYTPVDVKTLILRVGRGGGAYEETHDDLTGVLDENNYIKSPYDLRKEIRELREELGCLRLHHFEILHVYEHSSQEEVQECHDEQAAARDIVLQLPIGKYLGRLLLAPGKIESIRAISEDESREYSEGAIAWEEGDFPAKEPGDLSLRLSREGDLYPF